MNEGMIIYAFVWVSNWLITSITTLIATILPTVCQNYTLLQLLQLIWGTKRLRKILQNTLHIAFLYFSLCKKQKHNISIDSIDLL